MARRVRWLLSGGFALLAAAWVLPACEATLETECVGGDGTCDGHPMGGPTTTVTTGAGGAGGGAACFDGCDITAVSGSVGDFPCEVEAVMDNCRRCHTTPAKNGAPFPLDTYEESQALYGGKTVWSRLVGQVEADIMPAQPPKLSDTEKAVLIDWACQCAKPRDMGVSCN